MIAQPGLCRTWSGTPKTSFLRTRLISSECPQPFLLHMCGFSKCITQVLRARAYPVFIHFLCQLCKKHNDVPTMVLFVTVIDQVSLSVVIKSASPAGGPEGTTKIAST